MKVGLFEKNLPMQLELINKDVGMYNIYAPGQIDLKWLENLADNPPEDCKYITVFSKDNDREFDSLFKHFCDKRNIKWYKIHQKLEDGKDFTHYIADLYGQITEEMLKNG